MASYKDLFLLMDIDGNGVVSFDEVCTLCEALGITRPVLQRLFNQADTDGNGTIDKFEFSALCEGIILIANMTEEALVESFAEQEMRRFFTYQCSSSSGNLSREEMRTLLDRLNMLLGTNVTTDFMQQVIREEGKKGGENEAANSSGSGRDTPTSQVVEYGFEQFKRIIRRVYPQRQSWEIARAFLEEEQRRKERLSKMRSMFEKNQMGNGTDSTPAGKKLDGKGKRVPSSAGGRGGAAGGDGGGGEGVVVTECERCARYDDVCTELRELTTDKIPALEKKVAETDETIAMHQVEHMTQTTNMQQRVRELERVERDIRSENDALHNKNSNLLKMVEELAEERSTSTQDTEQLIKEKEQLQDDLAAAQRDLEQGQYRLKLKDEDTAQTEETITNLKRRLQEREQDVERLDQMLHNESQLLEEESIRMSRLMLETKRRCEEKESETLLTEKQLDVLAQKLAQRQSELERREDNVKLREINVMQFDGEMRRRWNVTFVEGEKQLEEQRHELEVRELDAVHREAEITVREQAFEANVARAESCSLPERERRMNLLKQIEVDLAAREKSIRSAERKYLDQLTFPELDRLRQQLNELTEKNYKLVSELKDVTRTRDNLKERMKNMVAASSSVRSARFAHAHGSMSTQIGNSPSGFKSPRSRAGTTIGSRPQLASDSSPQTASDNVELSENQKSLRPPAPMTLDEFVRDKTGGAAVDKSSAARATTRKEPTSPAATGSGGSAVTSPTPMTQGSAVNTVQRRRSQTTVSQKPKSPSVKFDL